MNRIVRSLATAAAALACAWYGIAAESPLAQRPEVNLAEFVAGEGRNGPICFYGEAEGVRVLSACSRSETEQFLRKMQLQRFTMLQLLPEVLRKPYTAPLLFLLRRRGDDEEVLLPVGGIRPRLPTQTIGLVDVDEMAFWRSFPAGDSPTVDRMLLPLAHFMSLKDAGPEWAQGELLSAFASFWVRGENIEFVDLPPSKLSIPSIEEFFGWHPNLGALSGIPGAADSYWHVMFARWALFADEVRAKAFVTFAQRTLTEPVSSSLFLECFGVSFRDVNTQIQRDVRAGKFPARIARALPRAPTLPTTAVRPATALEIACLTSEWRRLIANRSTMGRTPVPGEVREGWLREVLTSLQSRYDAGERDVELRTVLALAACDLRLDADAFPHLEASAAANVPRPRVYYELARIRLATFNAGNLRRRPLTADEFAGIWEPLSVARRLRPVPASIYSLAAEVLALAGRRPTEDELAMLREGVRQFPTLVALAKRLAEFDRSVRDALANDMDDGALFRSMSFSPALDGPAPNQLRVVARGEGSSPGTPNSSPQPPAGLGARLGSWSPNYARSVQLAPDERAPRYEVPRTGDLVFHLLPKSLQLNPLLEMTVKTTFTPYGRKIPPATPERPVYYAMQSAGFRALGEAVGGLRPPPAERLERVARQALAYNGYVPADEAHPASLAVMLTWGAYHSPMARGIYSEIPADFSNLQSDSAAARRISQVLVGGGTSYRSRDREKYSALTDQAQGDLYFVLASAYDGAELARGNRRLVWRTYMTVGATGISMNESLGPLIASAGPYLGREMNEPEFTSHSISRVGTVEIGPSKIIESDVKIEARGAGRPLDQKP